MSIEFFADPPYTTYGQPPEDHPRVWAKTGASSPHRNPDGSLCLWYPLDSESRRWTSDKGLLDLIWIVQRHLFLENYWRMSGGHRGGKWILEDAPHGLAS
ncbi:hypothetical protein [Actinomadura mexicana]|uniref:hypothetical protein n=1 Tax=Actinomadura mexicana TaxID=134959 RepID=UPI001178A2CC|nr:hypothetical protein [Actinomadura mexicana]